MLIDTLYIYIWPTNLQSVPLGYIIYLHLTQKCTECTAFLEAVTFIQETAIVVMQFRTLTSFSPQAQSTKGLLFDY